MIEDQRAFNRMIFDSTDEKSRMERLRVLGLGVIEETLEVLRTFDFKVHRRSKLRLQNVAHSHEELIDVFKYWLSLADLTDFPLERLEELYFAKSRVVQYRYQEEWVKQLDQDARVVVVDIDQVLADYIAGICRWGRARGQDLMGLTHDEAQAMRERLDELQRTHGWVTSDTVGLPHLQWQKVKHDFRTNGGKVVIPVFKDARPFLEWCKHQGWTIILVTSRPIAEYPNIFTDTLTWLKMNELPFDHLWWSHEKGERLEEADIAVRHQIVFAVDDSPTFVKQFRSKGIPTYQLDRGGLKPDLQDDPYYVTSLKDLVLREEMKKETK
jgi:FMN phosphatase YigB (HAD superfamily)